MTTFSVTGASCHTTFDGMKSDIQIELKKKLVFSNTLLCKEVQSSIEKFHWSKKLRNTANLCFNLRIRVSLESFNLFLHVSCPKIIFTMQHYMKLQRASESSEYFGADNLPCEIWDNLPQRHFFTCNRLTATMFERFMLLTSRRIR